MLGKYISHAGGIVDGVVYSNSLEALNKSFMLGHKFIEIDISKTNDGKYVLIHDFFETRIKLFGKEGEVSEEEFLKDKMLKDLTPLSLDQALTWFLEHENIYLVSDTKNVELLEILAYVKENFPEMVSRFIPQMFHYHEYEEIKKLGFNQIIYALYRNEDSEEKILDFIKDKDFIAVSMGKERVEDGMAKKIRRLGVKTIVFTVNELKEQGYYENLGVDVFFTDYLR